MTLTAHFYGYDSLSITADDGAESIFFNPVLSPRTLFFKRTPLALPSITMLERVSTAVVSCGDFHHCDLFSFKYFTSHLRVVVPTGLGGFMRNHLPNTVIELLDTPTGTPFTLQASPALRSKNALRPIRGSIDSNYLLEWQGKRLLFLFHPPAIGSMEQWVQTPLDAVFLSLGESPWSLLLTSKHRLSETVKRTAAMLHDRTAIIPIGWGGFLNAGETTSPHLTAWQQFATTLSTTIQSKIKIINPGHSSPL